MNILGGALNIFSILIFIRIFLSWFDGNIYFGRPFDILRGITDPYLNYFRKFKGLRAGNIDLSPIVALAVLSIANSIVSTVARFGRISLGIVLAVCLGVLWSAASFIIGFFIIVLALRLVAYLVNADTYASFWRIIDAIASPVQFRITRILFQNRTVSYLTGLIAAIVVLVFLGTALGIITHLLQKLFIGVLI